jgi:thioredoxin 1
MSKLQVTHDASFAADVERSAGLVLVDFAAEWCGPCRLVHPILEQIGEELAGRVSIFTIDADHNPATVIRFGIRSMPTVLFVRDGVVVDRLVGALPKRAFVAKIEEHLHAGAVV